ncbi:NACHT domain-containing protein [Streptomyces sp. NPDC050085]|uniref:NACHT domain-containing protein n=1 Tax=Streptomyces sp. NPDC050085 TaxID=3365600 RepID=UPI0037A2A333
MLSLLLGTGWAVLAVARGDLEPQDTAGLLGVPLGILGMLIGTSLSLKALRLQRASDGLGVALDRLAENVLRAELAERGHLLGSGSHLIDLAVDAVPRHGEEHPAGRESLSRIVEWYCAKPGRLVVTGEPGAGKSVLAVHLVVRLLATRGATDPVPVRLSIRDLSLSPQTWWGRGGRNGSYGLERWLADRLAAAYGTDPAAAAELVARRRVIPVLDGLDEMDSSVDEGRAAWALWALNTYQSVDGSAPLVLMCRTRRYSELSEELYWLSEAAQVRLRGVDAGQARAYVAVRTDGRGSGLDDMLDALAAAPQDSPLALALSSPFYLGLAFTLFGERGGARPELDFASADELREYLLARFVPVATETANMTALKAAWSLAGEPVSRSRRRWYHPDTVYRWLYHLTDPEGGLAPTGSVVGRRWAACAGALSLSTAGLGVWALLEWLGPGLVPAHWWEHRRGVALSAVAVAALAAPLGGVLGAMADDEGLAWMPDQDPQRRRRFTEVVRRTPLSVWLVILAALGFGLWPAGLVVLGAAAAEAGWLPAVPAAGWPAGLVIGFLGWLVICAGGRAEGGTLVAHTGRGQAVACLGAPLLVIVRAMVELLPEPPPAGPTRAPTVSVPLLGEQTVLTLLLGLVGGALLVGVLELCRRRGLFSGFAMAGTAFALWHVVFFAGVGPSTGFWGGALEGGLLFYALGCVLLGARTADRTRHGLARLRSGAAALGRRVPGGAADPVFLVGMCGLGLGAGRLLGFAGAVAVAALWPLCVLLVLAIERILRLAGFLRGRLPLRRAAFLVWAYHAGLLRYAAGRYQIRHVELRQWMERNPPDNGRA